MKTLTRIKGMKFISLLMALAMVFVLVGCGSSGNTQPAVSQGTNGEITAAAPKEGDSAAEAVSETAQSGDKTETEAESTPQLPGDGAASVSNISSVENVPLITLNNGVQVPQLGLGTQIQRLEQDSSEEGRKLLNDTSHDAVVAALQAGYRHLDTAHGYFNERGVGHGIIDSGVPREEIWVTSKLWPSEYGEGVTAKKGVRERGKRLLTTIFRDNSIMLMFLMPDGKAESVKRVFDYLERGLGLERFLRLFPVFLTDNGGEFKKVDELELTEDFVFRTNVFYCDPMASWQKPHIEKNHEFIRYVIPRGKSLNPYAQEDMTLLMNHINSTRRPGLGNKAPYELINEEDEDMWALFELLKMDLIPPDEVHLMPDLFTINR